MDTNTYKENHDWFKLLLSRRSLSILFLVIFCDTCILLSSAFNTKHMSVLSPHRFHETISSSRRAVQNASSEGMQSITGVGTKIDGSKSSSTNDRNQRIPFIIQRLGRGNKQEIEEITKLCVGVFFNDQEDSPNNDDKSPVAPWKAVQLAYLRNSQKGDIVSRNAFKKDQLVDLLVARRVYSVDSSLCISSDAKIINCDNQVFNSDQLTSLGEGESSLIAGEIIGYCEIMEKEFGLGGKFEGDDSSDNIEEVEEEEGAEENKLRPYLGNLAVVKYARCSGVGSKLMEEGEQVVRDWDAGHTEIVLQVEEDNPSAIEFYKRRGWELVFADPTCRRYDTSGFFLKETRITKYAMIKRLDQQQADNNTKGESNEESLIDKLRNSFFVSK